MWGGWNSGLAWGDTSKKTVVEGIAVLLIAAVLYVYRVVVQDKKPLLLRLQFHLAAEHIDAGDYSSFFHVGRLLIHRRRSLHLRLGRIDSRSSGDGLHVAAADHQHHKIARVLVGSLCCSSAFTTGAQIVDGLQVQQPLSDKTSRVKNRKRSHHGRNAGNTAGEAQGRSWSLSGCIPLSLLSQPGATSLRSV